MSPQVNTVLPARTLLLGWGPYALLYLYATVADAISISPKLQMVQTPPAHQCPLPICARLFFPISFSGFIASMIGSLFLFSSECL